MISAPISITAPEDAIAGIMGKNEQPSCHGANGDMGKKRVIEKMDVFSQQWRKLTRQHMRMKDESRHLVVKGSPQRF